MLPEGCAALNVSLQQQVHEVIFSSNISVNSGQTVGCHTAIPDQYLAIFVFATSEQPFKRRHLAPVLAVQLCISVCLTLAPTTLIMTSDFWKYSKHRTNVQAGHFSSFINSYSLVILFKFIYASV